MNASALETALWRRHLNQASLMQTPCICESGCSNMILLLSLMGSTICICSFLDGRFIMCEISCAADEVKTGISAHFVEHYKEVFDLALDYDPSQVSKVKTGTEATL